MRMVLFCHTSIYGWNALGGGVSDNRRGPKSPRYNLGGPVECHLRITSRLSGERAPSLRPVQTKHTIAPAAHQDTNMYMAALHPAVSTTRAHDRLPTVAPSDHENTKKPKPSPDAVVDPNRLGFVIFSSLIVYIISAVIGALARLIVMLRHTVMRTNSVFVLSAFWSANDAASNGGMDDRNPATVSHRAPKRSASLPGTMERSFGPYHAARATPTCDGPQ